ncbi:MAG: VanZ family protein [Spirochaetia bacterium]|jgi:VanZ family protein|nr:VanZ family protein [Spirochaetia bacterium]
MIKHHLPIFRAIGFISIALTILILSLVPKPPEIIREFALSDKIMHLAAYIALAFSMGFILPHSFKVKTVVLFTIISSSLFGGLIEFLQGFTGRSPELLDLFFDTAGAEFGIFLYYAFNNIMTKYIIKE